MQSTTPTQSRGITPFHGHRIGQFALQAYLPIGRVYKSNVAARETARRDMCRVLALFLRYQLPVHEWELVKAILTHVTTDQSLARFVDHEIPPNVRVLAHVVHGHCAVDTASERALALLCTVSLLWAANSQSHSAVCSWIRDCIGPVFEEEWKKRTGSPLPNPSPDIATEFIRPIYGFMLPPAEYAVLQHNPYTLFNRFGQLVQGPAHATYYFASHPTPETEGTFVFFSHMQIEAMRYFIEDFVAGLFSEYISDLGAIEALCDTAMGLNYLGSLIHPGIDLDYDGSDGRGRTKSCYVLGWLAHHRQTQPDTWPCVLTDLRSYFNSSFRKVWWDVFPGVDVPTRLKDGQLRGADQHEIDYTFTVPGESGILSAPQAYMRHEAISLVSDGEDTLGVVFADGWQTVPTTDPPDIKTILASRNLADSLMRSITASSITPVSEHSGLALLGGEAEAVDEIGQAEPRFSPWRFAWDLITSIV